MTMKTNSRPISVGRREVAVTWMLAAGLLLALALTSAKGPSDIVGLLNGISPAAGQVVNQVRIPPAPAVRDDEGGLDACSARDYADERC